MVTEDASFLGSAEHFTRVQSEPSFNYGIYLVYRKRGLPRSFRIQASKGVVCVFIVKWIRDVFLINTLNHLKVLLYAFMNE